MSDSVTDRICVDTCPTPKSFKFSVFPIVNFSVLHSLHATKIFVSLFHFCVDTFKHKKLQFSVLHSQCKTQLPSLFSLRLFKNVTLNFIKLCFLRHSNMNNREIENGQKAKVLKEKVNWISRWPKSDTFFVKFLKICHFSDGFLENLGERDNDYKNRTRSRSRDIAYQNRTRSGFLRCLQNSPIL